MDFADIKNKSAAELKELIAEWKAELRELRFKAAGRSLKQVNKMIEIRRMVARAMTVLREKNNK